MTTTSRMMNKHPDLDIGEEAEDFQKVVKTTSGHLAIVDAAILRNNDNPAVLDAVIFPTKQTVGEEHFFKVVGSYDNAILRELTMAPASIEDRQAHEKNRADKEKVKDTKDAKGAMVSETQLTGHDRTGGVPSRVAKTVARIDGTGRSSSKSVEIGGAKRSKRNRQDSDNEAPKLNPADSVTARIAQRVSMKGRAPQPEQEPKKNNKIKILPGAASTTKLPLAASAEHPGRSMKIKQPIELECVEFLLKVNNGTISEQFVDSMKFSREIFYNLRELRRLASDGKKINNFDLVYKAHGILETKFLDSVNDNMSIVENLLRGGLPLV